MSHKILLFTHKPLDTYDKGVQVQSYQNLINEGFEILQTRIITRFSEFFNLFPLNGGRGFLGDIINNAVDMAYFIGDAVGYFDQSGVWNFCPICCHKV